MSKKIVIPYETIYNLYIVQNLSKEKVAEILDCSVDVIDRQLKEYQIKSHTPKDWLVKPKINLSKEQTDILYGALLGDGCLSKKQNGLNAQFSYLSSSYEHTQFVYQFFNDFSSLGVVQGSYYDKRTNKTYTRYYFKTIHNVTFEEERMKWYKNNKKVVPNDLRLNSTICLVWYIGDGSLCTSKYSQYIQLSTDCFPYEDVLYLCSQLSEFEAKSMKQKENVYRIYIPHHQIKNFLQYIGDCPFKDYQHKWNLKEYKNFSILNQPELIEQILNMFHKGYSAGTIAKTLKMDRSTVVKYLIKNGLNPKNNLYRKKVVIDE